MRSAALPSRLILGASATNDHVQQMARSLYDADRLAEYVTGAVDVWRNPMARRVRRGIHQWLPRLDRQLARRSIREVPDDRVRARWRWDLARTVVRLAGAGPRLQDQLWERAELALDGYSASRLGDPDIGGYLGVEFGALASLTEARRLGKPGFVAFLSPHHRTRRRWVDPECAAWPELQSESDRDLAVLAEARDARRDREGDMAEWIVTGSTFTTRTLIDGGFAATKILTVPLGGPTPVLRSALPQQRPPVATFMYAGSIAIHKGAHHLLEAWERLAPTRAELHFYGTPLLPTALLDRARQGRAGASLVFHGLVSAAELRAAYLRASVLVLPTLADGFGQVVTEALACGLPVITTTNAGAADRIESGVSGFVVPPADVNALAGAMHWCLTNPDLLFEMRDAALTAAGRWTWEDFRRSFSSQIGAAMGAERLERATA
ncbi:MAG: glycosyltransferase [Vicinamibacterales bacterium]